VYNGAMQTPTLLLLLAGCQCGATSEPTLPATTDHFGEFGPMIDAVVTGRNEAVRTMARDMTGGDPGGSAALGSALGFLQIAEVEELPEGLAAAAEACGECHQRLAVEPPPFVPWTHRGSGAFLVGIPLWGRSDGPRVREGDVRSAWDGQQGREARLAAAIRACQGCHAGDPVVDSDGFDQLCSDPCGGRVRLWKLPGKAVDRMVQTGDLRSCSHVMTRWATADGKVAHSASDRPATPDQAERFRSQVDRFMGDRVVAAEIECGTTPP